MGFRDRVATKLRILAGTLDGRPAETSVPRVTFTEEEAYCLALLTEEAGEVLEVVGKSGRFGLDTPMKAGTANGEITARGKLAVEMGDILAAVEFSLRHRLVARKDVEAARDRKLAKLLDVDALDNLGRPLAPQPFVMPDFDDGNWTFEVRRRRRSLLEILLPSRKEVRP
jgi:NTP pyrophosphatase (non-canonical NTP hydrolase)